MDMMCDHDTSMTTAKPECRLAVQVGAAWHLGSAVCMVVAKAGECVSVVVVGWWWEWARLSRRTRWACEGHCPGRTPLPVGEHQLSKLSDNHS